MGIIDNSGDIIIDAVLTDTGREFLARNDGSFEIVRFAFGDDEIDYSLFNVNTGSLQQDTNVMNTPIMESSVNEKIALKYQLISIANPDLKYLPILNCSLTTLNLDEKNDSQVGKSVDFYQQMVSNSLVVPSEIVDGSFMIQMNGELLYIERQTPVHVTQNEIAQYVLPRTAIASGQGSQITFKVAVQSLTNDLWDTLGVGTVGSRTITTKLRCQGVLSGLMKEISVVITENYTR